MLGSESDSDD